MARGNPETVRRYREEHREAIAAYQKRWRGENRDRLRAYYVANKEKLIDADRKRRLANPEKYRAKGRRHYHRSGVDTKWGLPVGTYESLRAQQGQKCAICGEMQFVRRFHLDHDHKTGAVRGLLCGSCNRGVGLFRDDPELLVRAARYVNDPPAMWRDLHVTKLGYRQKRKRNAGRVA